MLDGVPIYSEDRDNVNDLYLQQARQFSFKLELLKKQNKEQLRLLFQKKKGLEQKANALKKQLLDSLIEVERTVADGRAKVR